MIGYVAGEVLALRGNSLILTNQGIGFEIRVEPGLLLSLRPGAALCLNTRMVVREDEISLYGFEQIAELEIFDLLCSVSGVGPKMALAAIGSLGASEISKAILEQNETALTKISGVGIKTARLILLTLSGKLIQLNEAQPGELGSQVISALVGLGLSESEATRLVNLAMADLGPSATDQDLLRAALQARRS